jgi:mannose-6-phosphate isomerase-like protein (cupin superfamily)
MTSVVRGNKKEPIAEEQNHLVLRTLACVEEHGRDVSVTWVRIDGRHLRLRNLRTSRLYYILEGMIVFEVNLDQPVALSPGDLLVLSPGDEYALEGAGSYLVINGPAFEVGDDGYV